jgi:hypothetical protein
MFENIFKLHVLFLILLLHHGYAIPVPPQDVVQGRKVEVIDTQTEAANILFSISVAEAAGRKSSPPHSAGHQSPPPQSAGHRSPPPHSAGHQSSQRQGGRLRICELY